MSDTAKVFGTTYTGVTALKVGDGNAGTLTYIRPTGTKSITSNGAGIDVSEFAAVDVSVSGGGGSVNLQAKTNIDPTESSQTIEPDSGYDGLSSVQINAISSSYVGSGITSRSSTDLTASGDTVTAPAGYYASAATKAVAAGTAGTPTATKGTVSNHSISVTPSVTNTTGYITGSTKTGTAVTVSASELVSGTKSITINQNGTTTEDVTDYATASITANVGDGRNLLPFSKADDHWLFSPTDKARATEGDPTYIITFDEVSTDTAIGAADRVAFNYDLIKNKHVVFSFYAKSPASATQCQMLITLEPYTSAMYDTSTRTKYLNESIYFTPTGDWQHITWEADITDASFSTGTGTFPVADTLYLRFILYKWTTTYPQIQVKQLKLEVGPVATSWSPAPEDGLFLRDRTVTPTESEQTIDAGAKCYGLNSVTIEAIPSDYVGSAIDERSSTDLTASGATVTAPAGYYAAAATKSVASGSATTPATTVTANPSISVNSSTGLITSTASATQSVTPTVSAGYVSSGTAGTITVSGSNTSQLSTQAAATITPTESEQTAVAAGKYTTGIVKVGAISSTYVGSGITSRSSTDLTASGATVTVPAGYYASQATKSVSTGSANPAASISGSSATVSTGTNTLTLSKTVSNTPQVTAGYVSAGTAGNTSVSLTASVTTKAAATITPGTSNQTIASGTYLTGTQTISGDANLVAGNIKSGVSIFGVSGSLAFSTITVSSSNPTGGSNGDVWIKTS